MDNDMWEMFIGAVRERELEALTDRQVRCTKLRTQSPGTCMRACFDGLCSCTLQFKEILVGWIVGAAILDPPAILSTVFRAAAARAAKAKAAAGPPAAAAGPGAMGAARPPTTSPVAQATGA